MCPPPLKSAAGRLETTCVTERSNLLLREMFYLKRDLETCFIYQKYLVLILSRKSMASSDAFGTSVRILGATGDLFRIIFTLVVETITCYFNFLECNSLTIRKGSKILSQQRLLGYVCLNVCFTKSNFNKHVFS